MREPLNIPFQVKRKHRRGNPIFVQFREKHRTEVEAFFNNLTCGECPYRSEEPKLSFSQGPQYYTCSLAPHKLVTNNRGCILGLEVISEEGFSRAFTTWDHNDRCG